MATLKLTIFKAKVLKDGRHKIRVAVCHHQETSYIVTQFVIDNISQFKNGQVVKRADSALMNMKLRTMLNEYQKRLDTINDVDLYSCTQLKDMIARGAIKHEADTFAKVCDDYIEELCKNGRIKYANMLSDTKRYFGEFAKGDVGLADITPDFIELFSSYINRKNWSDATKGIVLRNVRTIINKAIKRRLVSYAINPFISCKIPRPPVRDVSLSVETLRKILHSEPDSRYMQISRDIFALSFYLGGINMIDLVNIKFDNEYVVSFSREKVKGRTASNNEIKLHINDAARVILSRWVDKRTMKLNFGYNFGYENFRRHISRGVVKLAKNLGITNRVMFYSARKTFAQFASELGIPDSVINYCLGHSDQNRGVIRYYTKVRERQAEIAINRVIDYVENPEKYKEFLEMKADIMMMKM